MALAVCFRQIVRSFVLHVFLTAALHESENTTAAAVVAADLSSDDGADVVVTPPFDDEEDERKTYYTYQGLMFRSVSVDSRKLLRHGNVRTGWKPGMLGPTKHVRQMLLGQRSGSTTSTRSNILEVRMSRRGCTISLQT
jgi:hypothetical protein